MITTHAEYLTEVAKVAAAAKAYYDTDVEVMSDAEYDYLVDELEAASAAFGWTEADKVLNAVAAGVSGGGDVIHDVPMLSLGKVRTVQDILAFVAKQAPAKVVFEPKLDGLAISVLYKNGKLVRVATRGSGHAGEDLTENALNLKIKGMPRTLDTLDSIEVRGEIFIGKEDFKVAQAGRLAARGDEFANSRNAVSGSLRTSKDTSYVTMTFGAYEALGLTDDSYTARMRYIAKAGFIPAMSLVPAEVNKLVNLDDRIEGFGVARDFIDAPTDGSVVKFDSYAVRERLGAASRHPRWAVAYKYEAEVLQTQVLGITRDVGRSGAISYVANLAPAQFADSVVSKVTVNNSDYIAKKDIRTGDTVFLHKANDIIPEILSVNHALRPLNSEAYVAPITCPKCGEPLDTKSSIIWRCTNPEDAIGALVTYAVSRDILDVDGLSTAIVDALIETETIADLADLFNLTLNQLANVKTGVTDSGAVRVVGDKTAAKIHANLQKAKQQPLNRVISALGIRMTGPTFGRRLAAEFGSMEAILRATSADFVNRVKGVAEGRADAFVAGFKRNAELIAKLKAAGFAALQPQAAGSAVVSAPAGAPKGDKLAGLSVVVTGSVEGYSRTEIGELVDSLGGRASSSISAKTGLVVIGENAGSKADKAASLGLRTMTAVEFLEFIK